MSLRTKQPAFHRGEPRRCGWRSSCATAALFAGLKPAPERANPQTIAIALSGGDVRTGTSAYGDAGPPG